MNITSVIGLAVAVLALAPPAAAAGTSIPNIVLFFADDLGYGDLGCFGATKIATPHIDGLAKNGRRFTNFHVVQPVCSASRTGLLTGCYPNRLGIAGALNPKSNHGIHDNEMTLGELVRQKGYATAVFGKWHLGHHPQFLPTRHGFDTYFGIPYSNDMWPSHPEGKKSEFPLLPLVEDDRVVDGDVTSSDQALLTQQYIDRAVGFIRKNHKQPFLVYVPFTMPHVPIYASDKFRGKSQAGVYGDVVEEIDAGVGRVLGELDSLGIADQTLVIFTSDNGPWLSYGDHAGSAGPLREGKGTCWEGGVRVPCVMRWPGKIPANSVCDQPAMTIDLFPTIAKLIGAKLPDHKIDGLDIWPLLAGLPGAKNPHEAYYFYYENNQLQAVWDGRWKLQLPHVYRTLATGKGGKGGKPARYKNIPIQEPELYDLENDLGERSNVAAEKPEIVKRLLGYAETARADLGDSLTNRTGAGVRQPGRLGK